MSWVLFDILHGDAGPSRFFLLAVTSPSGPPMTPENSDLYVWTIARDEHFDSCIERNISTIDALLQHGASTNEYLLV